MRWKPSVPRYNEPIILQEALSDPAAARGTNVKNREILARVLKRLDTTDKDNVELPTGNGPENHFVAPGTYPNGWLAWWESPPAESTNPYQIPDPPTITRTVLPNREFPILWEASTPVKPDSNSWNAKISAIFADVNWTPQTGKEKIDGMTEVAINYARLKMRPSIIALAGINSIQWEVVRVNDNTVWKLESIIPSFRRGEFVELLVEQVHR